MKERTQFTCPKCGSHHYGSAMTPEGYSRSCHGCYAFTWNDTDDGKYMKPTGELEETTGIDMVSTPRKA